MNISNDFQCCHMDLLALALLTTISVIKVKNYDTSMNNDVSKETY